jgi:hypothetical protein
MTRLFSFYIRFDFGDHKKDRIDVSSAKKEEKKVILFLKALGSLRAGRISFNARTMRF